MHLDLALAQQMELGETGQRCSGINYVIIYEASVHPHKLLMTKLISQFFSLNKVDSDFSCCTEVNSLMTRRGDKSLTDTR